MSFPARLTISGLPTVPFTKLKKSLPAGTIVIRLLLIIARSTRHPGETTTLLTSVLLPQITSRNPSALKTIFLAAERVMPGMLMSGAIVQEPVQVLMFPDAIPRQISFRQTSHRCCRMLYHMPGCRPNYGKALTPGTSE